MLGVYLAAVQKYSAHRAAPPVRNLKRGTNSSHFFTGRSAEAGLDLTLWLSHSLSQSVNKPQMSHLETSNADSAQSKDVWNENLEFLMSSADCLLSADSLQNPNEPFRDF